MASADGDDLQIDRGRALRGKGINGGVDFVERFGGGVGCGSANLAGEVPKICIRGQCLAALAFHVLAHLVFDRVDDALWVAIRCAEGKRLFHSQGSTQYDAWGDGETIVEFSWCRVCRLSFGVKE